MSHKRLLKVQINVLSGAFEDNSQEVRYFLDLETGEVLMISERLYGVAEDLFMELEDSPTPQGIEALIAAQDHYDWEKAELQDALRIMSREERYTIIPGDDSRDGYEDMAAFIETVEEAHFRELLSVAIQGKGAFRRFKDTVSRDPEERQRWFDFKAARVEERIRQWLDQLGIELVSENED